MKKLKILLIIIIALTVVGFAAYGIYTQIGAVKFDEIVIDGVPEKAEGTTRIMSFNVRCANDGVQTITNRGKVSAEMLKVYMPDSFGVQECTPRWKRIIKRAVGDKYASVGRARDFYGPFTEYSSIYYLKDKYNLIDSGTFWLSETPDKAYTKSFNSMCYRIATWAVLENKETGERYTHINTHLDHKLDSTRDAQMKVLIEQVLKITGEGKVVMTGDFNAYEDSSVYAVACESFDDTKYIAKNTDKGPTFTKYGTKEDNGRGAIDFIFVSKGVKAESYKIIRNTVEGIYPSDHFPIVADIYI
ncbi:MAG: endonuclease/exonuclease/phosphatase family protein [Acutalibacteraceae bacterium]|nr:endonuclease/exonuclease/phosphatase family protein [Acutalibacteraceae bacterium]